MSKEITREEWLAASRKVTETWQEIVNQNLVEFYLDIRSSSEVIKQIASGELNPDERYEVVQNYLIALNTIAPKQI